MLADITIPLISGVATLNIEDQSPQKINNLGQEVLGVPQAQPVDLLLPPMDFQDVPSGSFMDLLAEGMPSPTRIPDDLAVPPMECQDITEVPSTVTLEESESWNILDLDDHMIEVLGPSPILCDFSMDEDCLTELGAEVDLYTDNNIYPTNSESPGSPEPGMSPTELVTFYISDQELEQIKARQVNPQKVSTAEVALAGLPQGPVIQKLWKDALKDLPQQVSSRDTPAM